jgi:predicted membrane protein
MRRSALSGIVFGLFVIFFGLLALANSVLGWSFHVTFSEFWALVIVALSIVSFIHRGFHFWNVMFFIIGLWVFLRDFPFFFGRIEFSALIAILIILLGLWIIIKAAFHPHSSYNPDGKAVNPDNSDYVDYNTIFSDNNTANSSKSFKGGHVSSVFGRAFVDLSQVEIQGNAVLEVSAVFGTLEVRMPRNIPYRTDVTPVFGSFLNNAPTLLPYEGAPYILIKGAAVFGSCILS